MINILVRIAILKFSMARSFYENDERIVTKPGYNAEINEQLKEQEGSHGIVGFVNGMEVRTFPILEKYAHKARVVLHDNLSYYGAELSTQLSSVSNELRNLSDEIKSVIKEPVLPAGIFVLTSALTGSILVNRRMLPIRFFTPIVFGGVAYKYFMPHSYIATADKITAYEQLHFPELYEKHIELTNKVQSERKNINGQTEEAKAQLQNSIHNMREFLINFFSEK